VGDGYFYTLSAVAQSFTAVGSVTGHNEWQKKVEN